MAENLTSNWLTFRALCLVLGGQDTRRLATCTDNGDLGKLVAMAAQQDMLPALAMRCNEQLSGRRALESLESEQLLAALRDNTVRNMEMKAQAIKIARRLNQVDIIPLFLKGTAQLLTDENGHIGFRKQVDIDVLVKPSQLSSAALALYADGYRFYNFPTDSYAQSEPPDLIATAIRKSAAHHHLPPLVKHEFTATVELHRHYLPKRFQGKCALEEIFDDAVQHTKHGAIFSIPSADYQAIHLILGKLVHDGYLARRNFPLREASDYIGLLERTGGAFDETLIKKCCGRSLPRFHHLVAELMSYPSPGPFAGTCDIAWDLHIMQKRYNSATVGGILNAYARAAHLSQSLLHNPARLPTYLRQLGGA